MDEKQSFIYILKLTPRYRNEQNWNDEANRIVSEHFNYLKRSMEEGTLLLAGRTSYDVSHDDTFGIAVFRALSKEDAQEFMDNDPAVKNGVMTAALHPFSLVLMKS